MQNKNILLKTQYADEKKFQQRMSMHKYGDQKKTQWEWMADIYQLKNYKKILDIGCGDGSFWLAMKNKTLLQQNIILADISQGMLDAAKTQISFQNIAGIFAFEIADIESLHYLNETFDLVLAHMMLYHAKSPLTALKEIRRVLKKDGTLGLSVLSIRTGKEYLSLANKLEPKIPPITAASGFTEEEADKVLSSHFTSIEKHVYENNYQWQSSAPVTELLRNYITVAPLNLPEKFFSSYSEQVEKIIQEKGSFNSLFRLALYICK